MSYTFHLLESESVIAKMIQEQINEHMTEILVDIQKPIEERVRVIIVAAIKAQPEYRSLLSGRLLGEFGLTSAAGKLGAIVDAWSKNIIVSKTAKGLRIEAITANFSNVLELDEAKQLTNKGESLDWLDWLLIKGDKTIIRQYEVSTQQLRGSRTGLATMVKTKRGKWHVPSQYAGTTSNNWVVRAINDIDDEHIYRIIIEAIEAKW